MALSNVMLAERCVSSHSGCRCIHVEEITGEVARSAAGWRPPPPPLGGLNVLMGQGQVVCAAQSFKGHLRRTASASE